MWIDWNLNTLQHAALNTVVLILFYTTHADHVR